MSFVEWLSYRGLFGEEKICLIVTWLPIVGNELLEALYTVCLSLCAHLSEGDDNGCDGD